MNEFDLSPLDVADHRMRRLPLGQFKQKLSVAGYPLTRSVWCIEARDYRPERDVTPDLSCHDRERINEKLWQEFFSDRSQWWDHRLEKVNPRYPDFKHKKREQGLWIIDNLTPPWVKAELATEIQVSPDPISQMHFSSNPISDRKIVREKLWREFFSDPSQWSDHRMEKVSPRYPDFKHKRTRESLWLDNSLTPPWVEAELATMAPGLLQSDRFSWNVRLRRHLKAQDYRKILIVYQEMQREAIMPDKSTFLPVLKACSYLRSLEAGRRVHGQIIERGYESDIYVATCLLDMYAKSGSIEDAWTVFSRMRERSVVSWTAMIGGYVKSEQGLKALELFREMQREGVEPDAVTFVGALNACASVSALEEGRRVHEQIIRRGCESSVYVATCLVDMYAKSGSIEDAWKVFSKMRERNVVSWSAMIVGYVKSQQGMKALELFREMQQEGVEPDAVIFVGALNACASVAALEEGRRVHGQIVQRGCEFQICVANCLVDMYAKCGSIEDAWSVFSRMHERSVISWTAMIGGYVNSKQGLKALELFREMQREGMEPDAVTFVGVLNACASVAALKEGRCVHQQIIQRGYESDVYVANCLIDMYAKCGSIEDAGSVFDRMLERSVVSWNVMIGAYVKSEQGLKALELFGKMQQEGVVPDAVTFVGAVNACASVAALEEGRLVHKQIIQRGYDSDVYVTNCLVDMYAKCGSIGDAWGVFDKMRGRNVVSWSAMIGGYVKSEQGLKALELFHNMQQEGVEPDTVTFVGAVNACASVAALREGRRVHKQIIQRGYESHVYVANCLIDMYAKCGSIKDARSVFNKMHKRDVVSWSAMIGGYAMHGHSKKAVELFERMGKEGVRIDEITFICLLSACNHGGLVEEGLRYFNTMTADYNLLPTRDHFGCLIDLLARAGRLEEAEEKAEEMMKSMPKERDSVVWRSLLGACRIHGNIEMAERAAKWCLELDPENVSAHVLLANTYAAAGKWDKGAVTEQDRLQRKVGKEPGLAWIQVRNVMHSFVVDDEEHPQLLQIYAKLEELSLQMNEVGYIPDMRFQSSEETEECHLCQPQ